jgi:hypothetical protein
MAGAAIRATPLRHVKGVAKQGRQAASLATQPKKQPKLKSRSENFLPSRSPLENIYKHNTSLPTTASPTEPQIVAGSSFPFRFL